MKKLLVLMLAGLLCAESAHALGPVYSQDVEYPFEAPKKHFLSDTKFNNPYRYLCIDGYVFITTRKKLSQVFQTSDSGNLTPIICPICSGKKTYGK